MEILCTKNPENPRLTRAGRAARTQRTAAEIVAQNAKDGAWLPKLGRFAGGATVGRTGKAPGQAPVDAQRNPFGRQTVRRFSVPREIRILRLWR